MLTVICKQIELTKQNIVIMKNLLTYIFLLMSNLLFGQWTRQITNLYPASLKDIYFIDENNGWAVGCSWNYPTPVLSTKDGGDTWLETGLIEMCNSVYFADVDTGFIGGSINNTTAQSTIWRTQNGSLGVSASWNEQLLDYPEEVSAISFINAQIGWAIIHDSYFHDNYKIIGTTDGGESWEHLAGGINSALLDICFANANQGWAVGRDQILSIDPIICRTIDGGLNWETKEIEMEDDISLHGVDFPDSINGWAVGDQGIILHTSNGGETWEFQVSGSYNRLRDVHFSDSYKGWAVGDSGTIIHTMDGGVNWEPQVSGTTEDLWSVYFIDNNKGWITGDNYTILHTIDGGVGIENQGENQYDLKLVPNPFKLYSKVVFALKNTSNLTISIFNQYGQKIENIFSGVLKNGNHEFELKSSNLVPGLYFIRLETESSISTIKIVKQ